MKKVLLAGIFIFSVLISQAQPGKYEPKQGMLLQYSVVVMGSAFDFSFDVDSLTPGYFSFRYTNTNGRWGRYSMTRPALDSATTVFWGPPHYEEEILLDEHTVMMTLSKKQFKDLQNNSSFMYDGNNCIKKPITGDKQLLVDGKAVDVIYMEGQTGNARFWIWNNPLLPLILQAENNPAGVDVQIQKITLPIVVPQN